MPYPRSLRYAIKKDHSSSVGALANLPSASATCRTEWVSYVVSGQQIKNAWAQRLEQDRADQTPAQ